MTAAKGKAQSKGVYADMIRFGLDLEVIQRAENLFAEAMREIAKAEGKGVRDIFDLGKLDSLVIGNDPRSAVYPERGRVDDPKTD
jgi:hypothetical protein